MEVWGQGSHATLRQPATSDIMEAREGSEDNSGAMTCDFALAGLDIFASAAALVTTPSSSVRSPGSGPSASANISNVLESALFNHHAHSGTLFFGKHSSWE